MIAAQPPRDAQPPAGAQPPADPGARGRLDIADRVIVRIAEQAAAEVDRATGAPRRVLGVSVGAQGDRPQVSARVDGRVATIGVVMSVAWPAPVAEVTDQVRARIVAQLAGLADIMTAQVDIRVTALVTEQRHDRRVN